MVHWLPREHLAFTQVAPPAPLRHAWILHGIYGRGRNWGALARHLTKRRPDWASLLIDLRLHGESPDMRPPHTVEACATDVLALEAYVDHAPRALIGHSFGGKVALLAAARGQFDRLQVWLMDSTPEARPPAGTAWRMLSVLRGLPPRWPSRQAAVEALERERIPPTVARWMVTNLVAEDGQYRWRLDFDAMEALLVDFFRLDLWDVVEAPPPGLDIHVVRAELSETLSRAACDRIERAGAMHGRTHLHRVTAGHWLHADNPEAVLALLARHLPADP